VARFWRGFGARRGKYNATPTTVDGKRFASKKEARRYAELKQLEQARAIRYLRTQLCYPLKVNGALIATYVADFVYVDAARGNAQVVEDVKGFKTREYTIKKKLMRALYGIEIKET
jgi:hypothetical protein